MIITNKQTIIAKKWSKVKLAFTLAEVLITLGIIGIVAALTIPTLIQNNQKQQIASRLQKAYSTLSQAIKLSELDNGAVSTWTYGDSTAAKSLTFMNTYLTPYLKVAKNCGTNISDGCWSATNYNCLNGAVDVIHSAIALTDGTFVGIYAISGGAFIFVDIDGRKGPNKLGRDVFQLMLTQTAASNFRLIVQNPGLYFYGAGIARSTLKDDTGLGCNLTASYAGRYCGAMIQLDGWKIANDYP